MRHWVNEVGQELRDVEAQISFFQGYVDSAIHGHGVRAEPELAP